MTRWKLLALLLFARGAVAQEPLPAFQRVSGLPHAVALRRIPAGARWDLVVALAASQPCEAAPRPCWWTTRDRLGILLQDRRDPDILQPLAIVSGPNDDCITRVERFTLQELVLSCVGEKPAVYHNQKFLYDLASRKLLRHFHYAPFAADRLAPGPKFLMTAADRQLVVEIDPGTGDPRLSAPLPPLPPESPVTFGPAGSFRLSTRKNRYGSGYCVIAGPGKIYPLPQTGAEAWARARPDDAATPIHLDPAEMNEQIGPHQVEAGLFWFGKTFYNAEGLTGVGGFGWFDSATAQYRLIVPPEIYRWSVSAILVESAAVWLGLYRRGEYGNYPGGLLRWDRQSEAVEHWELDAVATRIARAGDGIYLGATNGIAALRAGRITSYFIDRTADGQYQVVER